MPETTFVTCVESGPLETQVLWMVESLRRWGGDLAHSPVIAVKPRFGPAIAPTTRERMDQLQVRYLEVRRTDDYHWYHFLNKPRALLAAEAIATTSNIGWLDADLLIVGEPTELLLQPDEDLIACSPDNVGGTQGPQDEFEPFWRAMADALRIPLETLPWVTSEREQQRIRLYWNSGVFVYRRGKGLAAEYDACTKQLLGTKIRSSKTGIFFLEQASLGFAATKLNLKCRQLPHSHNYEMGSQIHSQWYREEKLRQASIIHYHDCLWPPFWATFIDCLNQTHPEMAQWLRAFGPLENQAFLPRRAWAKFLRSRRAKQESNFVARCRTL